MFDSETTSPPASLPRVVLADDHPMILDALTRLLGSRNAIVGRATNGRQALEMASEMFPDLLILDIAMPELDGLEVVRQLRARGLAVKTLILSFHVEPSWVQEALEAGADGYLGKTSVAQEIEAAVAEVLAGRFWLSPAVAKNLLPFRQAGEKIGPANAPSPTPPSPEGQGLTPREIEILDLLAGGLGNKEIAKRLGVSVTTVRSHLSSTYEKLGVDSRVGLALYAARLRPTAS